MLFPYHLKKYSIVAFFLGSILLYLYYTGIKPSWLQVPVFAVASTYLESRFLQMVETNLIDELGFVSIVIGFVLLVFSKEKNEESDAYLLIRYKAFTKAILTTFIAWTILYLVVYGYAIIVVSLAAFPLFVCIYYIWFRWLMFKSSI